MLDGAQIFQIWVLCKKNMRGRIVVKRSHSLRRGLAAVLASLTLIQCAPLTASAAWWPWSNETAAVEETVAPLSADVQLQNGTAIIPAGADEATVKQALFDALVVNKEGVDDPQNLEWEYYCTGKNWSGFTKENWGSVFGFTTGSGIAKYEYPALAANEDGEYQVRIDGTDETQAVTLTKASGLESSIVLKAGQSASVTYKEDGSIDYDALRAAIFAAVVESIDPVLTAADVTIEYHTKAVTDVDAKYVPLEGEKGTILNYPAMQLGNGQKIRISWNGNESYLGFSAETTVNIVEGRKTPDYTLKETPDAVTLSVGGDLKVDYDALRSAILSAVVESDFFTTDNVTITYYAENVVLGQPAGSHEWAPLEGATIKNALGIPLEYPAISAGEQKIRISYAGDETYAPVTIEATVTVKDREQVQFTLNEGPYEVGMKFTDDQGYDYAATAEAIYNAVVASTVNPEGLTAADVTVEYNADKTGITDSFKPLNETGFVKFGEGTWEIRISWAGDQTYRGGSVTVDVTTTDSRPASVVALKSGVSFTYNMDPAVMEQAIFDNLIDWDNSTLPARETLTIDNFTIEYKAKLTDAETGVDLDLDDILNKIPGLDDLISSDALTQWVPISGKIYTIPGIPGLTEDVEVGRFPQMGAGENQAVRITYNGGADYKPSSAEGTVTVNKANVSVKVNSTNIFAGDPIPEGFITTDPADKFDLYTIYAGITSNVTTGIYLDLPDRYTSEGSLVLKTIDAALAAIGQKTLTQMLNDGVTVGELRQLFNTQGLLDLLDKLNIDTGTFGQIMSVINKLPGILDSVRISFGTPNRAGLYTVAVVTDSKNYNTGVGMGFLLVRMRLSGSNLTWNADIPGGKLTAEQAKTFDFGATLSYNGDVSIDQSSVHYLYSGFTSSWRVYSSTTTPPTEPGRYVVTVCILGGNYMAAPLTRSFQITK